MGKKGAIKKIGGVKNHEKFCGKRILGSLFGKVYLEKPILGKPIQENLFRTPYTGNLFAKNLLRKPYSRKNLFMKTIGHTFFVKHYLQALQSTVPVANCFE